MNGGETNRLRVLVVDDEPGGRALAAHELRKEFEEFELIEIGEPRELAEAIENGGFDLVVTDYQLGWTDGLAVLQAVKRKYPDCPVVMFTGAVSEEFAVQAMKAGFDDYVLKSSQRFGGLKAAARTALDDAQRRRAQREAEVRHREFFDGVPVGMYRASVDGRILTANPAAAQILGSPDCESLIGLNVASLYADSAERGARLELGRPGVAEERELRFRRLDGRIIWVVNNARMTCDAAGNVLYSEAAIQDVTVRKQAELDLIQSRARLAEAQELAHLGSWEWDAVADRVYWSDELCRICELSRDQAPATYGDFLRQVHPDDRKVVRENVDKAFTTGEPQDYEYRIVLPSGGERILHGRTRMEFDAAGKPLRMRGSGQDVTERKRFEQELEKVRDEALEASRLKSAFLANMSHEIRTPLNVIVGYNTLISEAFDEAGREEHQPWVDGVSRATRRLIDTIQGILDMAKLETGGFEIVPKVLKLETVISEVLQLFQPLAGDKGLTVALELDEPEAEIVFDEYCLTHALRNLVGNAIKFTEAGSVTVRLFREASDRLAIEVRDTGVGIEDAYLPFLFKPFSQQESGYTRRFEGSGIGLAVTRRYLELNSASISVDTEKGCGSTFTVRFASDVAPAAAAAAAAQAPAPGPGPRARERATVLLVEDDPPTQAFMKQMLAPKFEVVCAATGEEARAQLAAHDVQMVLMDLSLRGPEDGLMLTRWLRQQARWEAVPVIATTAHALPEDRRKALAAGCDAYLAKPFHPSALLSLMQSLLPSSPEAPNPA